MVVVALEELLRGTAAVQGTVDRDRALACAPVPLLDVGLCLVCSLLILYAET